MKLILIIVLIVLVYPFQLYAGDITVGDFKLILAMVILTNLLIALVVMLLAKYLLQLQFSWWLPFLGSIIGFGLGFFIVELEIITSVPKTFFNFAFPLFFTLIFIFKFRDKKS